MIEGAKAEIMKKKAGAMKDMALADKATVETQSIHQQSAADHAQMMSGHLDQDQAMAVEMHRLQMAKAGQEDALAQREVAVKERQQQAAERGEAA